MDSQENIYHIADKIGTDWTIDKVGIDGSNLSGLQELKFLNGELYAIFVEDGRKLILFKRIGQNWVVDSQINLIGHFKSAKLLDNSGKILLALSEGSPNRLGLWSKIGSQWQILDLSEVIPSGEGISIGLSPYVKDGRIAMAFSTANWVCYLTDTKSLDLERFAYDSDPGSISLAVGSQGKPYVCYDNRWTKEVIFGTQK